MATQNKKNDEVEDDEDAQEFDNNDEVFDDFEKVEMKSGIRNNDFSARRRLEALKDDKKMKRLLSDEIDDWYNDLSDDFSYSIDEGGVDEVFYDDLH